ncbi:hypothetical protein BDV12DRAFT_164807 [Aspergillus spectabilis]
MASTTVVFITGARQGIGRSLLQVYLNRPNHLVIGAVRNPDATTELQALPTAAGTKLLLVAIENSNREHPAKALETIKVAGVTHIDIFIANAGTIPPFRSVDDVTPEDLLSAYEINATSALLLFQTFKPLLQAARQPKWVSTSTFGSSFALMGKIGGHATPAYGASKAALNWLTEAIHYSQEWLVVLCIHPGHVQTGPGNLFAHSIGLEQAPNTVEESSGNLVALIDRATRESHSGKFIDVISGDELPW